MDGVRLITKAQLNKNALFPQGMRKFWIRLYAEIKIYAMVKSWGINNIVG
jgi:hypothetical protein